MNIAAWLCLLSNRSRNIFSSLFRSHFTECAISIFKTLVAFIFQILGNNQFGFFLISAIYCPSFRTSRPSVQSHSQLKLTVVERGNSASILTPFCMLVYVCVKLDKEINPIKKTSSACQLQFNLGGFHCLCQTAQK